LLSRHELVNSIIDNTNKCSPHVTGCRKSKDVQVMLGLFPNANIVK